MKHLCLTALRLSILPILLFVLSVSCKDSTVSRTYTVAFETTGGTAVKSQTVKEEKKASQPDNPTRKGYAFGGWHQDKALTQSFDFNTPVKANITLYAKWVQSFTVTFDANEGSTVNPITTTKGNTIKKPDNPTKTDSIFDAWYTDNTFRESFEFANTPITTDITLYAKWNPIMYTVTFQTNKGTPPLIPITTTKGNTIKKPDNPTKKDSIFGGWYTDNTFQKSFEFANTPITADITLYAKWGQPVTVAFQTNKGTPIDSITIAKGNTIKNPDNPTKTDSIFGGWYTDNAFQESFEFANTPITADTTLYAKWNPIIYTVTFQTNEGTLVPSITIAKGNTINQPDIPTKQDSIFDAWYTDHTFRKSFEFANTPITADITLYAKWNPIMYTVTFQTNKGTPSLMPITIAKGTTINQPDNPTKTDFIFDGWYTDNAFQKSFEFANTPITADTTLYAKWGQPVTVAFQTNEGTPVPSITIAKGNTINQPDIPTKTDSIFGAWCTDNTFQESFDFANTPITADITLYAKWGQPITVTFETNGGSPVHPITIAKGNTIKKPTPTKGKSTLLSWCRKNDLTQSFNFNTPIIADITLYAKYGFRIPDENFRNKLKTIIPAAFTEDVIDTAHSNVIVVQTMNVSDAGIKSLAGIEYFTALTALYCENNQLTSLNLTTNTKLKHLLCNNNQLTSLDVATNTMLIALSCNNNQLTSLDVATNTMLMNLLCTSNKLTSLDVATNTVLKALYCNNNQLTSLDLATNTMLTVLYCQTNKLTSLNLATNTALTALYCYTNKLTSLDVATNTMLTQLFCNNNQLTSLDVATNTALTALFCQTNQLTSLDVATNTQLIALACSNNQLKSLDVRGMASVDRLYIISTGITRTNPLTSLRILDVAKDHDRIKAIKTKWGAAVTITTYNSDRTTVICNNYDPNEDKCLKL